MGTSSKIEKKAEELTDDEVMEEIFNKKTVKELRKVVKEVDEKSKKRKKREE